MQKLHILLLIQLSTASADFTLNQLRLGADSGVGRCIDLNGFVMWDRQIAEFHKNDATDFGLSF